MTPVDREYLRSYVPQADIRTIPTGVDTNHYTPLEATPEEPLRVLFLGNFRHLPNVEALQFLKEHLIPVFPKLQFQVAGNNLPIGVSGWHRSRNARLPI